MTDFGSSVEQFLTKSARQFSISTSFSNFSGPILCNTLCLMTNSNHKLIFKLLLTAFDHSPFSTSLRKFSAVGCINWVPASAIRTSALVLRPILCKCWPTIRISSWSKTLSPDFRRTFRTKAAVHSFGDPTASSKSELSLLASTSTTLLWPLLAVFEFFLVFCILMRPLVLLKTMISFYLALGGVKSISFCWKFYLLFVFLG